MGKSSRWQHLGVPVEEARNPSYNAIWRLAVGDFIYEYVRGVVVLSSDVRHMVVLPQYADLLKRIPAGLEGIGSKNVKPDIDTGLVTFDASLAVSSDASLFICGIFANLCAFTYFFG